MVMTRSKPKQLFVKNTMNSTGSIPATNQHRVSTHFTSQVRSLQGSQVSSENVNSRWNMVAQQRQVASPVVSERLYSLDSHTNVLGQSAGPLSLKMLCLNKSKSDEAQPQFYSSQRIASPLVDSKKIPVS